MAIELPQNTHDGASEERREWQRLEQICDVRIDVLGAPLESPDLEDDASRIGHGGCREGPQCGAVTTLGGRAGSPFRIAVSEQLDVFGAAGLREERGDYRGGLVRLPDAVKVSIDD